MTNEVHLYENRREVGDGWLAIRLDGGEGDVNRAAIGARVTVTAGGVSQTQELTSGYGHFGLQNDTVLTFALGDCASAAEVEVVWPNQAREQSRYERVAGGRLVELRRGEAEPFAVVGE
jgi:hypothetical protein